MKIKKEDTVLVTSGKYRGKTGKIEKALTKIGNVAYQYRQWKDGKWNDDIRTGEIHHLNYITIRTKCPDAA